MVGSAILRLCKSKGLSNIIVKTLNELDLTRQSDVEKFFKSERPEIVIIAAAKVGGILANNIYRAEFIYDNLMIEANLINASYKNNTEKLIFLGSSCIYPKFAPQPMKEEYILSGYLEETNEPYAIAKIAGIKLCENYYRQYNANFYSVMPTNMFGPNDNFDPQSSHVLAALIRKFHEARVNHSPVVHLWGTGQPLREFLYVDDLAEAIMFLAENFNAEDIYKMGISHINIGTGKEISIIELAGLIGEITGYSGELEFDTTKPDGTPRKLMDNSRMTELGWSAATGLKEGIKKAYQWYVENKA